MNLLHLFNFRALNGYQGIFQDRIFKPFSYKKIIDSLSDNSKGIQSEDALYSNLSNLIDTYYNTDRAETSNYVDIIISIIANRLLEDTDYIEPDESIYRTLISELRRGER